MRYLGFIPARAGSKGIPKKNIALLNGNPLIWHTIHGAQQSRLRDSLFLSSDSQEIIDYCKGLGIKGDYKRPDFLATDQASTVDAVLHALEYLSSQGQRPENVVLLQPTSPLRTPVEIDSAIELFEQRNLQSLVGVNTMREHPYECIESAEGRTWSYLRRSPINATRRQDYLEKFYYINGALYIVNTDYLFKNKCFVTEGETYLFEMSSCNAIDIDEPLDLYMAEAYFRFSEKGRL